MKTIFLFGLMLTLCVALVGCGFNKDSEVNAFLTELNKTTDDMAAKIDANPTSAGVDEAQKVFDAKKADLQTKWSAVKDARGAQVSADVQKKMETDMKKNADTLSGMMTKHTADMMKDPAMAQKLSKLMTDYGNVFK